MRRALTIMLFALAACGRTSDGPPQKQTVVPPTTAAAPEDDGGQALAMAAGRRLLNTPAPALALTTIAGHRIDLAKLNGKRPVYLKFWATWCVPCRQQMADFERDYSTYGKDITVIAVNTGFNDTKEAVLSYRQEHGLTMPIVIDDGTLAKALNLRVTPQHVVIGRDGRIAFVGHLEDEQLHRAIRSAIAQVQPTSAPRASNPVTATSAPSFATTTDGKRFPISGSSDAGLRALLFLSPWCEPYYKESRPKTAENCRRFREQANALASTSGVRWLGVASGLWSTPDDLKRYSTKKGIRMPLTLDANGDIFRTFGIHDVPFVILIDAKGRVVRRIGPDTTDLGKEISSAVVAS